MNMPGFTAQDSLYKTSKYYAYRGHSPLPEGGVSPALIRRTTGGISGGQLSLGFTCKGLLCSCNGDNDCNDMFTSNVCGEFALCDETGCYCLRIRQ